MTRQLIKLLIVTCMFTSTPACAGAPLKWGESKQLLSDQQKKEPDEMVLVLRDLLYCDKTFDEALDFFVAKDEALSLALDDVRAKNYEHALTTLRGLKARSDSVEDLPYRLTLAAAHKGAGNIEEARASLRHLLSAKEARTRIEAWTLLRELGETPPAQQADEVLGVVVEIALDKGVVIIAGYEDGMARYFSSAGGGVIGDPMPEPVQQAAKALTQTAAPLVRTTAAGARGDLPPRGHVRITMLTPSGARVAEVADGRAEDPKNPLHEVYIAAYKLFQELQKTSKNR